MCVTVVEHFRARYNDNCVGLVDKSVQSLGGDACKRELDFNMLTTQGHRRMNKHHCKSSTQI